MPEPLWQKLWPEDPNRPRGQAPQSEVVLNDLQDKSIEGLQRLMPQPAGLTSPAVERAMGALQRKTPGVWRGINVKNLPLDHSLSFSNTYAQTPAVIPDSMKRFYEGVMAKNPAELNTISMNPAVGMVFPDEEIETTLAHELKHVDQNRTEDPFPRMMERLELPYDQRQEEKAAFAAENAYRSSRPTTTPPAEVERMANDIRPAIRQLFLLNNPDQR